MKKWTKWINPKMKGYVMECCDCGLKHELDFRAIEVISKTDKQGLREVNLLPRKKFRVMFRVSRVDNE